MQLPRGPFSLYVPDAQRVTRQRLLANASAENPYWTRVWPAALALAGYIQKNVSLFAGKKVAELGAGLGLPSLVAAHYAQSVWCSDMEADAMHLAHKSAQWHHLSNIRFVTCNWNLLPDDLEADVVLLSDINYDPQVFDRLEQVLLALLQKGCTLLLATPQRLMARAFVEKLLPYATGSDTEEIPSGTGTVAVSILLLQAG